MKKAVIFMLMLSLCCVARGQAFSTAGWWTPPAPKFSPVVADDGMVTFRIKAPDADKVVLLFGECDVIPRPMDKNAEGVWETTVGPVAPGVYEYKFQVDGIKVLDYGNPSLKYGTEIYGNTVEVCGPEPRFDERVHSGSQVDCISYRSSSFGTLRRVCVYVPEQYFKKRWKRFPVLYLRHGGGDDERSWWDSASADAILDNLIASGEAVPMLVVMTDGLTEDKTWAGGSSPEGMKLLEEELVNDVMPLVEKRYRVKKNRKYRAIAGLSMGGSQAFVMGLHREDLFSYVGEFSSSLLAEDYFDYQAYGIDFSPERINRRYKLIWLSCGVKDPRWPGHVALAEKYSGQGLQFEFQSADYGHEWQFWREQLRDFAKRLFR